MQSAIAVATTVERAAARLPTIAAVCRPIKGGAVEPEFVAEEIRRQGFPLISLTTESADFTQADVLLFLGNAAWRPRIVQQLRRLPPDQRPLVAVWHWEPLPPPLASGLPRPRLGVREVGKIVLRDARATDPYTNAATLQRMLSDGLIDLLAVSTRGRQEFLAERGFPAHFIPLGYGPQHGEDLRAERDIDILFLGDANFARRRRILGQFKDAGLEVTVAGDWRHPRYWGEQRTALLNRVKILLNVPRAQGDYSGLRMLLGAANGAMILSEPLYRPEPFLPGQHYVEGELAEVPTLARQYLDNDDLRSAFTSAARELATQAATRERSVAALLPLIEHERLRSDA